MITNEKLPNLKRVEVNYWVRNNLNEKWKTKLDIIYSDESRDKIREHYLNRHSYGKISINSIKIN
jgi:hypothetical protein